MPWSKKLCCGNALKNNVQQKKLKHLRKKYSAIFLSEHFSLVLDFFLSGQRVWAKAIKCKLGANSMTENRSNDNWKCCSGALKSDLNC